ncbi:hypothetical protein L6452_16792 [Arctium lappa]|uniref:Uncharacterized protein n=1 Tax=Arctium lappa TaxID=4217 RepID=A0ACB9C1H2_ARCLA|nr:hypothetical protein L6452_16792 [Arctium lappa]
MGEPSNPLNTLTNAIDDLEDLSSSQNRPPAIGPSQAVVTSVHTIGIRKSRTPDLNEPLPDPEVPNTSIGALLHRTLDEGFMATDEVLGHSTTTTFVPVIPYRPLALRSTPNVIILNSKGEPFDQPPPSPFLHNILMLRNSPEQEVEMKQNLNSDSPDHTHRETTRSIPPNSTRVETHTQPLEENNPGGYEDSFERMARKGKTVKEREAAEIAADWDLILGLSAELLLADFEDWAMFKAFGISLLG